MAKFFNDLGAIRKGAEVSEERVRAAKDSCRNGTPVNSLTELMHFLEERFPSDMPYFASSISESNGFAPKLAAFNVSLARSWSKDQTIGIYAVYGKHILKMLENARSSMEPTKYRDELAGANQHYANGLWPLGRILCAETLVRLPCFAEAVTVLFAVQEGVKAQRTACSLRAQKYASPGSSMSHVKSYESSLYNLADACEVLLNLQPQNVPDIGPRVIQRLRSVAKDLLLVQNETLRTQINEGSQGTTEDMDRFKLERRMPALAIELLPKPEKQASTVCLACSGGAPTMIGFICKCCCLCDACGAEYSDNLAECPSCGEWTVFVRA